MCARGSLNKLGLLQSAPYPPHGIIEAVVRELLPPTLSRILQVSHLADSPFSSKWILGVILNSNKKTQKKAIERAKRTS